MSKANNIRNKYRMSTTNKKTEVIDNPTHKRIYSDRETRGTHARQLASSCTQL